jgi:hypothetical protein
MENILMYSTDEIDFNKLKSFKYDKFKSIAYGKINNKWWYVYGSYDYEIYNPKPQRFEGMAAFEHLTKKAISSSILLQICDTFGEYINSNNTDFEVKGIGGGNLIKCIEDNIEHLLSGENMCTNEYAFYRQ